MQQKRQMSEKLQFVILILPATTQKNSLTCTFTYLQIVFINVLQLFRHLALPSPPSLLDPSLNPTPDPAQTLPKPLSPPEMSLDRESAERILKDRNSTTL